MSNLIITALLSLIVGVIITLLTQRVSRQRKSLGYEVLYSSPIIDFEPKPGNPIQIFVPSHIVKGGKPSPDDEGIPLSPVNKVYGFRVRLQNTGNVTLENQDVLVELDSVAKIVSVAIEERE